MAVKSDHATANPTAGGSGTRTLDESHQRSFKMFEEAMQESLEERKKAVKKQYLLLFGLLTLFER